MTNLTKIPTWLVEASRKSTPKDKLNQTKNEQIIPRVKIYFKGKWCIDYKELFKFIPIYFTDMR